MSRGADRTFQWRVRAGNVLPRAAAPRAVSSRSSASESSARARSVTFCPASVKPHTALVTLDELHAEEILELLYARRERRLRNELRLRGSVEIQTLRQLDQIGELAQGWERSHCERA